MGTGESLGEFGPESGILDGVTGFDDQRSATAQGVIPRLLMEGLHLIEQGLLTLDIGSGSESYQQNSYLEAQLCTPSFARRTWRICPASSIPSRASWAEASSPG